MLYDFKTYSLNYGVGYKIQSSTYLTYLVHNYNIYFT